MRHLNIPERIALDHPDQLVLCRSRVADARAIANAVAESLAHLRPWMPWAGNDDSADETFQRERLLTLERQWDQGEEFSYVLMQVGSPGVLGSCGLMTGRGPRTLEIGYWTHVAVGGRGYGKALAKGLTAVAMQLSEIDEVLIVCDAANQRSAAIPRSLGYRLKVMQPRQKTAPAESGEEMIWVMLGRGSAR